MSARTVAVRLSAEVGSYITGMKNAASATRDLASDVLDNAEKNKAAWNDVGQALGAFGLAVGAGVGVAVKKFSDFDEAMSEVRASTHETAENMESLRDAALDAGAKTAFSAIEAAEGINELAKAGVSTRDILSGGLMGALDLAAAGGLEVGAAAEIAASALTQFGLSGTDVGHVADLLAAGAGKAQGSVADMGAALNQAGLVANATGLTIEETTTALAAFASAGLTGSDAGTSLKSMLQRLNPASEEAANLMGKLGFSAYDSQGQFIGLEALAGELGTSLAGMSEQQRAAAMNTLFGSDAVRAATVLYEQGAAGVADWSKKVDDTGYASETAALKLDNLKGDMEALGGSIETALIGSGSVGNDVLRSLAQSATGAVNAFIGLPAPLQQVVGGIAAMVSGVALAGGAVLLIISKIAELRAAIEVLGVSARVTAAALTAIKWAAIGAGAAAVVIGVEALDRALSAAQPSVDAFRSAIADFAAGAGVTGAMVEAFGEDFSMLAEKMDRASQSKWFSMDWGTSRTDITEAREALTNLDAALASLATGGHPELAEQQMRAIEAAAAAQGVSVRDLKEQFPQYAAALEKNAADAKIAATETDGLAGSQKILAGQVMDATGKVISETDALMENMAAIREATGLVLGLRDANRGYEAALDEATAAVKENGRTLDTTTEAGRKNEAALDAIASSAQDVLTAMIESGEPLDRVSGKLGAQRDALIKAATSFGMTKEAAVAYADSVLQIPTARTTTVTAPGAPTAKNQIDAVRTALGQLYDKTVNVTTVHRNVYIAQRDGVGGGIQRAAGGWVNGPGTATSDSIAARLSNGEFVVNARSAGQHAALLEAINSNRFATGGWVGGSSAPSVTVSGPTVDLTALLDANVAMTAELRALRVTVAALPEQHQTRQRQGVS